MKKFIILLSTLTIFLYFFWSTGIPLGNVILPFSLILTYFILFLYSTKFRQFLNIVFKIIKETPLKYLLLFILWGILSSFFLVVKHDSLLISFRIIRDYFLFVFPILVLPSFLMPKYLTLKKFTKIILIIYTFVIAYGLIDYIIQLLFPAFHIVLYKLICSGVKLDISTLKRANSIFFEPTFFATFIFIFLPFLYNLKKTPFTIFGIKNAINYIIILSWIALFLTKSPIYILFAIIYTVIYSRKKKKFLIYMSVILIFFFSCNTLIKNAPVTQRIINTVNSLGSMQSLVYNEGSLATRIGLMYLSLQITKEHPFIGVGYANSKSAMYNKIVNSKIPLTDEIIRNNFINDGLTISSIFFQTLCWNGIIGCCLLYMFLIKTILIINKLKQRFDKTHYLILSGFELMSVNYILCSIYWSLIADTMLWFIFGILTAFVFRYKKANIVKIGAKE